MGELCFCYGRSVALDQYLVTVTLTVVEWVREPLVPFMVTV
jgi:hypothetical protein